MISISFSLFLNEVATLRALVKGQVSSKASDNQISPQDYQNMKQRVEKDLTGLQLKLKDLKEDKSPYKTYINQTVPMLENIVEYYRKSDVTTNKKI
jgi:hypothetical protein